MSDGTAPETAAKPKGMPGWVIVLAVLGGLTVLCLGASFVGAVSILVPRIQAKQAQVQCANQLRHLGGAWVGAELQRGDRPAEGGVPCFIRLTQRAGVSSLNLICPGDEQAGVPLIAYDPDADPGTLDEAALRSVCSYAVRDFERFPLDPDDADGIEFVAADVGEHHRDGVNVLHANGGVHFHDRESLGLAPEDPIVVGPDSPHPELRKLCIVPAR